MTKTVLTATNEEQKDEEFIKIEFKTKRAYSGNICQYSIYCDNIYSQNYEAFLQAKEMSQTQKQAQKEADDRAEIVKAQLEQPKLDADQE